MKLINLIVLVLFVSQRSYGSSQSFQIGLNFKQCKKICLNSKDSWPIEVILKKHLSSAYENVQIMEIELERSFAKTTIVADVTIWKKHILDSGKNYYRFTVRSYQKGDDPRRAMQQASPYIEVKGMESTYKFSGIKFDNHESNVTTLITLQDIKL
jgi:hypothetical protein